MRRSVSAVAVASLLLAPSAGCSTERDRAATAERIGTVEPLETWRGHEILECDYAVDLPVAPTRSEDHPVPAPEIVTYLYVTDRARSRAGLAAACTVFPFGMELPPDDEMLRKYVDRHLVSVGDLGGGLRDRRYDASPEGDLPGLHYEFTFASFKVLEGRALKVGLQVHDLWAIHDGSEDQRRDLARLWTSYLRR